MIEKIAKIQNDKENYKNSFFYYERARDAMFDVINELHKDGYDDVYIPGYIGWSSREGSGIFDPINRIPGLKRHYYLMTRALEIDVENLIQQIKQHSVLLIVNYFGFRDKRIKEIIHAAHDKECVVIEDNAHGFYTYFCKERVGSDVTFFSLHKLFPFDEGGGLVIDGRLSCDLHNMDTPVEFNPFQYDINEIARVREENYRALAELINSKRDYFVPLRGNEWLSDNVPQTYPIIIKTGDRDKLYFSMNDAGYGVVSLYHTMIEELRNDTYSDALWLSQRIMNLPVHQDVDKSLYPQMVEELAKLCEETKK